jgi:HSP20 family protein
MWPGQDRFETELEGGKMGKARNPFRGIVDTMSEMARMREYAEGGGGQGEGRRTHATAWVPTTDIFAVGEDLVIRCELPGVGREDVEISLSGGALIIDGERKGEPEASEYYARERHYGHFRRRIKLPEDIDRSDISASFENGLLEVTVTGGVDRNEPERIEIG